MACHVAFHHRLDAALVERNNTQTATMAQATTVKTYNDRINTILALIDNKPTTCVFHPLCTNACLLAYFLMAFT